MVLAKYYMTQKAILTCRDIFSMVISSLLLVSKEIYRWSIKRSSHVNTTVATNGAEIADLSGAS